MNPEPEVIETPVPPATAPPETETLAPEVLEVLESPQLDGADEAPEPEDVVEAAEQLLRESAPHDFDVLVLGGGPGGYVCALRAAQLGARVGLVEEREVGGVCLNRGCIPTKTLLESVDVLRLFQRAGEYGIRLSGEIAPDFEQMHARKREVVAQLRGNVEALLEETGVTMLQGRGRFVGEHTIEISGAEGTRRTTAVHVVIATGGVPARLLIPGAELPGVVTSDELLENTHLPRRLVTIGAGAVGVEFAYLYRAVGCESTILEKSAHVLPQEDRDIATEMERVLRGVGIGLEFDADLKRIEEDANGLRVVFERDDQEQSLFTDMVLMAAGRRANTQGLGMEEADIAHNKGRIIVDEHCETSVGGVYAIGDVTRNVGWAHQASAEGKMVAEWVCNHPTTLDLKHVPSCYYTHPEIASVGLTLDAAKKQGIAARAGTFHFRANGRAASAGEHDGFVKIVIEEGSEKIIGAQIIGPRATDLINEAVLALKTEQTVDGLIGAIHAHPTFSEALPEAALQAARGLTDLAD